MKVDLKVVKMAALMDEIMVGMMAVLMVAM